MKFKVQSRGEAVSSNTELAPHIIISISDTPEDKADVATNDHTLDVLQLAFHDINTQIDGFTHFDTTHADKILDFFQRYRGEAKVVIAHCQMGQCRSPAVAAALQRIELGNDSEWFKRKTPNSRVYSIILGQAVEREIFDPFA